MSSGRQDVGDERIGRVCTLRQEELADRVVGDHVLGIGDFDPFDLGVRDDVAVVDDAGVGFAERNLAQNAGDLLLEACRVDGDLRFGKGLPGVVARGNRGIGEDDDQARAREVGQAVDAFGISALNHDLEPVVHEHLGIAGEQTRVIERVHVCRVRRGENIGLGALLQAVKEARR